MKSLADGLPPEIARQIHPDWRKNEAAYWAVRDQLLKQYQGQWIGFADGAALVGLPPTSPRPSPRGARRDQWSRGWHGRDDWLSDLGLAGWSGVSVPAASRLRGPGANPGARCAQPLERAVPWSQRRGHR